ncbi:hypothetical protein [Spiribacter roseus]|uniref:hypothetical protein n=1 Tax=Spiribacter roseus TaxID=1855875 RepID=UPI001331048C|nr:hypothetical protein [Spiribacter roseus]
MISASDREQAVTLIDEARSAGARLGRACEEIGIDRRTYYRWCGDGGVRCDGRAGGHSPGTGEQAIGRRGVIVNCGV